MVSTFTQNCGLEEPALGDYVNSWNVPNNSNFTVIDNVFGGQSPQVFGSANITLTVAQAAYFNFVCTGALTANVKLILPSTIGGRRVVTNNCSGAFTLTILNGSADPGGGVVCPQGAITPVLLTGTSVLQGTAYLDSKGNVTGPASSTVGHISLFNNATGTLLSDSGLAVPASAIVGLTDAQTLTNKTLTSPALTVSPTAPTQASGDNSTLIATDAFVQAALANINYPRQTVWTGPQSAGLPTFLPSTSINLNLTTQNVAVGAPLIVSAALGFAAGGPQNYVGATTSNLTWTALTAVSTNYLYVSVSSAGVLTTGFTTLAPIYQFSGTPATTAGQYTFNIVTMTGYLGNGSTAPQVELVFVGQAVTAASTITSTIAYAYNGYFDSGWVAPIPAAGALTTVTTNLGVVPNISTLQLLNTTAQFGYNPGQIISGNQLATNTGGATYVPVPIIPSVNSVSFITAQTANFATVQNGTWNFGQNFTTTSWSYRIIASRGWNVA